MDLPADEVRPGQAVASSSNRHCGWCVPPRGGPFVCLLPRTYLKGGLEVKPADTQHLLLSCPSDRLKRCRMGPALRTILPKSTLRRRRRCQRRRSGRTLIAGVVISPCDGRGPRGLCDCLPGGGRRSGRT